MIESLRYVRGSIPAPEHGENIWKGAWVLQYFDGEKWIDVPFFIDEK